MEDACEECTDTNHGSVCKGGSERGGGESRNEYAASGSEEGSGATLAPDATLHAVRDGARLILNYDPAGNAFTDTVENTTRNALSNVRIAVHGTEFSRLKAADHAAVAQATKLCRDGIVKIVKTKNRPDWNDLLLG